MEFPRDARPCPGCGADLSRDGSIKRNEGHTIEGLTWMSDDGTVQPLPLYDSERFGDIKYDSVYESNSACVECGCEL